MKKGFFTFILFASLISCNNNQKLEVEFSDDLNVTDLLQQSQFAKLSADEAYKEYALDYWENKLDIYDVVLHGTEMMGMININAKSASIRSGANNAANAIKSIGSLSIDALQGMSLDDDRAKMYASFSDEKRKTAESFEKEVNNIFLKSSTQFTNEKVKKDDLLQNYKSFKAVITDDDDLENDLDELTDKVDDLFTISNEIRTKIYLHLQLNKNLSFTSIAEYANKIVNSNGTFEASTNSQILQKYFDLLGNVSENINEVKTKKYPTPIEDWSDEKKANFYFILDDITVRIKQDISGFNIKS